MLCSVIIPTWNRSGYITRAVDSCLAQHYSPVEILVMDDGSTDDTRPLIEGKYANGNLPAGKTVVYHYLRHGGVSAARNAGLAAARGEWIAYLDSDNTWLPNCLSDVLAPLGRGAISAYGMLEMLPSKAFGYGHHVLFMPYERNALLYQNFIDLNVFAHTKKAALDCGGFDESLTRFVDWDFILRITKEEPAVGVRSIVAYYQHDDMIERITNYAPLESNLSAIFKKNYAEIMRSIIPARLHATDIPVWCGTLAQPLWHKAWLKVWADFHGTRPVQRKACL